jgi:membrane-associated protease RseP (regulator of RpoE activity)
MPLCALYFPCFHLRLRMFRCIGRKTVPDSITCLSSAAGVDVQAGAAIVSRTDPRIDVQAAIATIKKTGLNLTMKSKCSLDSNPLHGCVIVKSLEPNSAAADSALVVGDTIAWVGSKNTVTLDQVQKEVGYLRLGGAASMVVIAMRADGIRHAVTLPVQ